MKNRKPKDSSSLMNSFTTLVFETFQIIFKKIVSLAEMLIQAPSKNRVINLTQNLKNEKKNDGNQKLKYDLQNTKQEFQEIQCILEEFKQSYVHKQDRHYEFSPIQLYNSYEEEKEINAIEERMNVEFKKIEERCETIEDDLGDILLLCKEFIIAK